MLKYLLGDRQYVRNKADAELIKISNSDKLYAENCQIIGI